MPTPNALFCAGLLALGALCAHASEAETPKPNPTAIDPLQQTMVSAATIERLRIGFTLERELALFPEPITATGELVIDRKRGAVRWHFEDEVTLILVGDSLRRWGPDGVEEAVDLQRDPGAQALVQQMSAFRDGDWSRMDQLFERKDGDGKIVFTPRSNDLKRVLSQVSLELREDGAAVRTLLITSTNGDLTRYIFGEPQIEPELDERLFTGP